MKSLLPLLALAALSGCMSIGRPFPSGRVLDIRIGVTKQDDLVRLFGQPYRQGIDDGDQTWTYVDYKYRLFGEESTRDLLVRFKPDGTVRSYSFNSNFPEDRK